MDSKSNQSTGVIISAELSDQYGSWDWPLSYIKGEIEDDEGGRKFKFNHKSFKGWFEATPLVGKRVRFLRFAGWNGLVAEEVELE